MSSLRIEKVNELPSTFTGNTLYLQAVGTTELRIYLSDKDGTSVLHIPTENETLSHTVIRAAEAPTFPCKSMFWFDIDTGALFLQHIIDDVAMWVEAMPSIAIPEFGGNGVAGTMSRSDHTHDSIVINAQW